MAQIVPKLNLNKTPAITENNSLIFAKNIRLDADGNIHKDYGISSILFEEIENGSAYYENIALRIIKDIDELHTEYPAEHYHYNYFLENIKRAADYNNWIEDEYHVDNVSKDIYFAGFISDNNNFYILIRFSSTWGNALHRTNIRFDCIIKYSEDTKKFYPCNCNWNWNGGDITGYVIKNLVGDTILVIGEDDTLQNLPPIYKNDVPLKFININKSSYTDDETFYTQLPNVPIANIHFGGFFSYTIPNGVYQFFIRYKVREDFYTDWFPASRELFTGNQETTDTNFGTLKYVNTHKDSFNSFILNVEYLYEDIAKNYESYQIGFILSHDDTIVGRAWKHFDVNETSIKFDYRGEEAEEVDITDFTKHSFQLYNVGNICSFKNKLYVSNYNESNFNDKLQELANNIKITIENKSISTAYYDGQVVTETAVGDKTFISMLNINGTNKSIYNIAKDLLSIETQTPGFTTPISVKSFITSLLSNDTNINNWISSIRDNLYGIDISLSRYTLQELRNEVEKYLTDEKGYSNLEMDYNEEVYNVNINNKNVGDIDNCSFNQIRDAITSYITYLTYDGNFITNKNIIVNKISGYVWRTVPYTYSGGSGNHRYGQKFTINFTTYKNKFTFGDVKHFINNTTLIPYQRYKFYIHFVKQNGETTNGYYCGGNDAGELECSGADINAINKIYYPVFKRITIPDDYVACFFTILHSAITSSTIFNINDKIGRCVDIDCGLLPVQKKITVKQASYEFEGNYYHSSDSSDINLFGSCGAVKITDDSQNPRLNGSIAFAVTDYESKQEKDVELIKCTPYIKKEEIEETEDIIYDNYSELNLLGYICIISPLNFGTALGYYSDGSTMYKKINDSNVLHLEELSKYNDGGNNRVETINILSSSLVYVYSNYNLNYLSTTEDAKPSLVTYYNYASSQITTDTDEARRNSAKTKFWRLLSSLNMSDIYTLHSMYKNYTRKTYSTYNEDDVVRFDNTIRSSILLGDEARASILKFDADDYYNVPTNKGIIVNLISVGDSILVHTKDSMFRFSGSNTLTSSNGDVATKESDVFDTGITEVFGSDYGFAGIQDKKESIVTEAGYIFYDRDSKIVYMYSGQGRIIKLSDKIEQIFNYSNIEKVVFANDYYNNRFFMCLHYTNDKTITLSFSYIDHSKSFISIHDFKYDKSFNTKTICYFISDDYSNIYSVNKKQVTKYDNLGLATDTIYPQIKANYQFRVKPYGSDSFLTLAGIQHSSIIDVIINENYETIKTLNNIEWVSAVIDKVFRDIDVNDTTTYLLSEPTKQLYPCSNIRIYTDTCCTELINCTQIANNASISDPNSYKYPRFNQGKWSLNYFRNILNTVDTFKYLDGYDDGRSGANYRSDNNSLVEGKYFVIRFVFKENFDFTLENLTINIKSKL